MTRNPIASSLKHFRQRIVPDKRDKAAEAAARFDWAEPEPDEDAR